MFYDNFVKLCAMVGKKPSAVALDIGINKSTVTNWKNRGTTPTDVTVQKIADYFDVSVEQLTGKNEKNPVTETNLTDEQQELVKLFDSASPELRAAALAVLRAANGEK